MSNRKRIGLSICTLLVAGAFLISCSRTPDTDANTTALIGIVKSDPQYAGAFKIECLQFMTEQDSAGHTDIAMREKHGNGCPGDPATSPVVDRFRIEKPSGIILRYDPVNDIYASVGKLRKQ